MFYVRKTHYLSEASIITTLILFVFWSRTALDFWHNARVELQNPPCFRSKSCTKSIGYLFFLLH